MSQVCQFGFEVTLSSKWQCLTETNAAIDVYVRLDPLAKMQFENRCHEIPCETLQSTVDLIWSLSLTSSYAFLILCDCQAVLISDSVNSIPLYWYASEPKVFISDKPYLLRDVLDTEALEFESVRQLARSGYVVGRDTILRKLKKSRPGETIWIDLEGSIANCEKHAPFYCLSGLLSDDSREAGTTTDDYQELVNAFETVVRDVIESANGRPIVCLLSAGKDSRLLLSMFSEFGAPRLIAVTYGKNGSFEVDAARKVALALKVRWIHVSHTSLSRRKNFSDAVFAKFVQMENNYASIPFMQDFFCMHKLWDDDLIPADSIIINGNTGDFLSGGHRLQSLSGSEQICFDDELRALAWKDYLKKNYSLWDFMCTNKSDAEINNLLVALYNDYYCETDSFAKQVTVASGIKYFQKLEHLTRQSCYVMRMQTAYDFFGYDWIMPFWDLRVVEKFGDLNPEDLNRQSAYIAMLKRKNYGRVWDRQFPINKHRAVGNFWFRVIRFSMKGLIYPLSRKAWRSFERRVFFYYTDEASNMSLFPYRSVLFSKYMFRNDFSWVTRFYIDRFCGSFNQMARQWISKR